MKDPSDEILTAFYTALQGNLTYNAATWNVYTSVVKSTDYDFVFLSGLNFIDAITKDKSILDCAISIEVVGGLHVGQASFKEVNSISNQILQLLVKINLSMTNFDMTVTPFVEDVDMFLDQADTSIVPRKVIRLRFGIQEK